MKSLCVNTIQKIVSEGEGPSSHANMFSFFLISTFLLNMFLRHMRPLTI